MTQRSDDALVTLLLTSRLVSSGATAFSPKEYWRLRRGVDHPAVLLGGNASDVAAGFGLTPDQSHRIASRLEAATQLAFELERLELQGYRVLTPFDEDYPPKLLERLGDQAPPAVTAVGPAELLRRVSIGLVGSRDVGAEAVGIAEEVARAAAGRGLGIVSGGAKGIDQRSMAAAVQAGTTVVGWLADPLERRLRDPDTRRVISEGRVALATPFKPDAGFSVANAMSRNKLIYATAQVTLIVTASSGKGGTWEGAVEALRGGFGPVAVWMGDGAGPGNEALVARGARPVSSIEDLFDGDQETDARSQLALDL